MLRLFEPKATRAELIELQREVNTLKAFVSVLNAEVFPPVPPKLPHYIEDMREGHPGMDDAELCEAVWLKALQDTQFYQDTGDTNSDGWRIFEPAPKQKIAKGQEVFAYRWAFRADGGSVREGVYGDDGYVINIKHFETP